MGWKLDVSNRPLTSQFIPYAWLVITKKQRELFGKEMRQKDSSGDFLVNTKLLRSIKPVGIAGNRKVIGGQNKLFSGDLFS